MPAERFVAQLNDQIGYEFAAHQQYLASAVYYDTLTLPQLAGFFYRQSVEERGHAMLMVRYLIDQCAPVVIPGIEAPVVDFDTVAHPVELALEQEKRVTDQINQLTRTAREEGDFASEVFMQWFITEQVEEVATISNLLTVVTRSQQNLEAVEEYVRREHATEAAGTQEPPQSG